MNPPLPFLAAIAARICSVRLFRLGPGPCTRSGSQVPAFRSRAWSCYRRTGASRRDDCGFDGPDAEGAWTWKIAYGACEAAQVLFLHKFGTAMRERAASPAPYLEMLAKLADLVPSHRRRSEESQAFQQFSTPIGFGYIAAVAAAITPADLVLEPSAGTGLLAIHAELVGSSLVLNELADGRAGLLDCLFPSIAVTRHEAAHIHDHLDDAVRPTVVLMNPPFSVAAHVNGHVADAALRHIASPLARVELCGFTDGMVGRLTTIGLISEIVAWKLRLFVPIGTSGPAIVAKLIERHPVVRVTDKAAG
jgi:predicted RNA methylase